MADDLVKLIITLAFPLIAFLSLIIWLAVVLQRDRGLSVNLRLLGLSLSVAARPLSKERRGSQPNSGAHYVSEKGSNEDN